MAEAKSAKSAKKPRAKKKRAAAEPRGLAADRLADAAVPAAVERLARDIASDGGSVLATFRDPLGSHWQILAGLPIERVEPTPYQRDLSETHVERLTDAIGKLGRFLDPVIAFRTDEGKYWTPNGNHRLAAMRNLGARAIAALVVPEREVAHRILVLNTEKSHNLREKALEVVRLAEALASLDPKPEKDYSIEFEEPSFLTLGKCYQLRGRFAGGAYHPVLKRVEKFLSAKLPAALETRARMAAKLIELDDAVADAVAKLKERGFESPYLKAFVVARVNPLRFQRGAKAEFDETIDKMLASARKFDAGKIRADQVASAGGAADE
jgi:ParB family chromosome partitioning protein